MAALWLPAVIKGFQSRHPGVTVSLHEDGNIGLARSLQDRSADVCFGLAPKGVDADWEALFTDEIVGWVPHGHPAEDRGYLTAEDLEQEAFIYTQPDQDTEIDRLIGELGVKPNVRFTTRNAFTTYHMVAAGLGISVDQRLRSRAWGGAVALASLDEVHQVFVAGRGPQATDVLIDSLGAAFGILLTALLLRRMRRKTG